MSIATRLTLEQSSRLLALSFHLMQQFQEKATLCGHRRRGQEESDHGGKSVRLVPLPKDRADPGIPAPRFVDRFHRACAGLISQELPQAREAFPGPFGSCSVDHPGGRSVRLRM